jgi:chromosome segregation ATPase
MTQKVGGIEFDVTVDANGVSSTSTSVQGDLKNLESAFSKVDSATKKTSGELRKLVTSLQESGKKVAANGKVYDAFGMEVKAATAQLDKLSKEALEAGAAASKSSKGLGSVGKNAGMAGIQIQQFVGQIQGGQSALLALSQQGADLGFVLGRAGLGAAVGIAATALSFLIPALTGAEEETESLRERIKELGDEITLTANQIKYLGSQNSKEADKLSDSSVKAFDKIRQLREELEKMQSAGVGLDTGDFAVPRSAEENQKRYADSIEETEEKIDKLLTTIDTNRQGIEKLAEDTTKLGEDTEKAGQSTRDHTTALQAQVIALESGAQAAEVYAATQAAVANGTEEQLPKVIELINRKYELKAAQEASTQAARDEAAAFKEQEASYREFLQALEEGEAINEAKKQRIDGNIESIRQSLMTETELRSQAFQTELEQMQEALENKRLTQAEHDEMVKAKAKQFSDDMVSIEQTRADKEKAIEQAKNREKMNAVAGVFGNLSSLMNTESKKLFKIGKIAALAETIVTGAANAQKAYAGGLRISGGNPAVGAAFAATSLAATAVQLQQIKSAQFGSAGGGQSFQGGQLTTNTSSQQQPEQRNVSIALTGSSFTGGDIRTLIGQINEELGDGVTLNTTGG